MTVAATQAEPIAAGGFVEKRRSSAMWRRRSRRWSACRAPSLPTRSAASACRSGSAACACSRSGTGSMCAARKTFDDMTTLSKELRAALAQHFTLARPEIAAEQISVDGTRKWLMRLPGELDGRPHEVECVYIPETDRGTLVHFEPGRLHAQLHVLPHRHAAPGAQSHARARSSARSCWRATGSATGRASSADAGTRAANEAASSPTSS